ncbi:MAG: DUF3899 domain-containing protein [Bacilli bacterium]
MPNKKDMPLTQEKPKKFTKDFLTGAIVSAIIAIIFSTSIYFYEIGTLNMDFESEKYNILSDTFSIPGLLFVLSYGLVVISNAGAFDMLNYAIGLAWTNVFHRNIRESKFAHSYAEYKEMKRAKDKKDNTFILYVGSVFLLVGVVFLILFYTSK